MAGDDLGHFARKIENLASSYQRSPKAVVTATAQTYTTAIRSSIGAVTTGSRLRGVGKYNGGTRQGARVGVRSVVSGSATTATAVVQATGPLHLIERDTRPHTIPRVSTRRKRTKTGRLSTNRETTGRDLQGSQPLFIAGDWVTGPVEHPGTRGKHPFARGAAAAGRTAKAVASSTLQTEVAKVLRGL